MKNCLCCSKAVRILLTCVYVTSTTPGCSQSTSSDGQMPGDQATNSSTNATGDRDEDAREPKGPTLPIPDEPVRQFVHSSFEFDSSRFRDFFDTDRADYAHLSARRRIGDYHNELPVAMLEAYLENESEPGVEIYLDLAIAYLTFGRFDDAARVLKEAKARPVGKLGQFVPVLKEHADRLIETLTAARDALLRDGVDVTYPDRQIFERAWLLADQKDDYLRLNIVDACDSAFPDSAASTRWVVDAHFSYLQTPSPKTNVPAVRGQTAFDRAMSAALSFKDEQQQLYAAVRLTQLIIGRIEWDTGLLSRSDVNTMIARSLQLDASPGVRAFLLYGHTKRALKKGWERRGYINELVRNMEEAVRLDDAQTEYTELLQHLKTNGSRLERQVIAAHKRRAEVAVARLFGSRHTMSDAEARRQRVNRLGTALIIGSIALVVVAAAAGGDSPVPVQESLTTTACRYCNGTGVDLYNEDFGQQCLKCNGSGHVSGSY